MRIYVSSTSMDLENHRRAVIRALLRSGHTPVCMEHHAAADVVPKDESLRGVATCDVYVGIFAWRYGFIPPQCDASITEMEYREAIRRGIPKIVFLLDEKVEWPAEFKDKGVNGQRIWELRDELKADQWVSFFSSPDNLATEVLAALQSLQPPEEPEPNPVPVPVPKTLIQHFQDREAELFRLHKCLINKDLRMVLICGRGGAGKTTLITKLMCELIDNFGKGYLPSTDVFESIVYVTLGDLQNRFPERIVELISRTLEHKAATKLKEVWNQGDIPLRERLVVLFGGPLAQHRCLIVLDNLESVMDDDNRISQEFDALRQFIDAFFEYDHAALLIVTSRRALSLSPNVEIAAVGRKVQVLLDEGLPEGSAIVLLRELDCDKEHPLGIRNATDHVLGSIARRCQCIPRTLETLVGVLLGRSTWTLDTLLANESYLAELIENPAKELYWSLSFDQERVVTQVLAMYDKPVPSTAVRFILPALRIDEILDKLVRNFVAVHDRGQFWLHPLDRQYAYSQIPEQGSDYSKQALHKLAAQFYRSIPCPPRGSRASLDDIAPMLNALEHLLAADQAEDAAELLLDSGLHEDLHWWGYYILLSDLCLKLLGYSISTKKKIALHIQLGKIERNLGKLEEAKRIYEDAITFIDEANDPESEIGLLIALGDISYFLGDMDRALEYHQRAEELLKVYPKAILQSENAGDMANIMYSKGEYGEAQRLYEQAIAFAREAGSKTGKIYEGIWNGNLGNVHDALFHSSGDSMYRESAISYYLRAIEIAKGENDRRNESQWKGVVGYFYGRLGEYELAEAYLKEALIISVRIHYDRVISSQVQWLVAAFREHSMQYVQKQDFETAFQICMSFCIISNEIGNAELQAKTEHIHGELTLNKIAFLIQEGRMKETIAECHEYLVTFGGKTDMCAALGSICMQWGRQTGQKDFFQLSIEAYTKAITMDPDDSRHSFFSGRADAYALLGKIEEAIADYSEAIRREPQNKGATLSRAEVLIWAGRYSEARVSLASLYPQLKSTAEKMIGAWLMCHALNLEGHEFSEYQKILEDKQVENIDLNYSVRDIEIYIQKLNRTKFTEKQILNAWMIQSLITKLSH
jgi:tetratricopeptide (TPR) repeat protein